LFGVQTSTAFVESPIASSIAGSTWRASASRGTSRLVAPVRPTAMG
jgi:hypothetical protein